MKSGRFQIHHHEGVARFGGGLLSPLAHLPFGGFAEARLKRRFGFRRIGKRPPYQLDALKIDRRPQRIVHAEIHLLFIVCGEYHRRPAGFQVFTHAVPNRVPHPAVHVSNVHAGVDFLQPF